MKIAATVSTYMQVSMEEYRDIHRTAIFDSSASIDDMVKWAKTVDKNATFHSLKLSVVDEVNRG